MKRFLPHTRCRKRGASWQLAAGHRAAGRRAASGNAIKESTSQCALIRGASDCRMPGLLAPAPTAAVPAAALSSLALLMFPLALLASASASFCVDSATSCVSSRRALYLVAVPSLSLDFLCLPLLSLAFPCFPFPSRPCLSLLLASFLISLAKASCCCTRSPPRKPVSRSSSTWQLAAHSGAQLAARQQEGKNTDGIEEQKHTEGGKRQGGLPSTSERR